MDRENASVSSGELLIRAKQVSEMLSTVLSTFFETLKGEIMEGLHVKSLRIQSSQLLSRDEMVNEMSKAINDKLFKVINGNRPTLLSIMRSSQMIVQEDDDDDSDLLHHASSLFTEVLEFLANQSLNEDLDTIVAAGDRNTIIALVEGLMPRIFRIFKSFILESQDDLLAAGFEKAAQIFMGKSKSGAVKFSRSATGISIIILFHSF